MSKIRCLIVEDEPLAQEVIQTYMARLPFLELVGTSENALEAYEILAKEPVDLLFCDIQMPLITGLEFLRSLTTKPLIIMTTAFHEYALEGYELDVVDYLMKPIAFERFLRSVSKAKDRLAWRLVQTQPLNNDSMPVSVTPSTSPKDNELPTDNHIFVKEDGRLVKVFFRDILYIEGMRDYVKIYVTERFIVTHLTLKKLEEVLPPADFIRVHKSYIVRQSEIKAINGNQIELDRTLRVPIGMQYREEVLRTIGRTVL